MKASDLLVRCLENEGVEYLFGLPGEENLDVMDALSNSRIRFVATRHEHLIENDLIVNLKFLLGKLPGKFSGVLTKMLDKTLNSLATQGLENCPELDDTGPTGH